VSKTVGDSSTQLGMTRWGEWPTIQTPTISTNTDTLNSQSLTRLVSIIRFL